MCFTTLRYLLALVVITGSRWSGGLPFARLRHTQLYPAHPGPKGNTGTVYDYLEAPPTPHSAPLVATGVTLSRLFC